MTDKELLDKRPTHNPLLTPEGYFDSFTDKLMQKLPEQQKDAEAPRFTIRHFFRYAAAAVVTAVCIGTGSYIYTRQSLPAQDSLSLTTSALAQADDEAVSDDYLDQAIDYELINNEDLAYYLTEAY
ncbi:MAG: hypothetical protein J5486_02815 [Bacteroidaceae bacterium]|nr:hypothetical protein [Bacteroidaceae bacterium]